MILTVGMSPCVDVTVRLKKLTTGKTNVALDKAVTYAGKANNVAVGISRLGEKSFVTGFMYNENGSLFEKALNKEGVPFSFIWNPGRVRENYKFIDEDGRLTEVNEEGRAVTVERLRDLLGMVRSQSLKSDAVVISGGAPKGTPDTYYRDLVEAAKGSSFIAVDTYGTRLRAALEAGVDLVKPNLDELSATFSREFTSIEECASAARELVELGAKRVLLSLGGEGAIIVDKNEAFLAKAPSVKVETTVGAGDAMVAAATTAILRGASLDETLRCAVSAGTACVVCKNDTSFTREQYDKTYEKTSVSPL